MLARNILEQLLFSTSDELIEDNFLRRVGRCIAKHVIRCVRTQPMSFPGNFHFSEDDRTAETRADLTQQLGNFDRAAFRIRGIGRECVADNYEDKVLQSLLNAAEALNPNPISASQVHLPQPTHISSAAVALYDDLDLHSSGSPASGHFAQTQAEPEGTPVSPVASDFSYIE